MAPRKNTRKGIFSAIGFGPRSESTDSELNRKEKQFMPILRLISFCKIFFRLASSKQDKRVDFRRCFFDKNPRFCYFALGVLEMPLKKYFYLHTYTVPSTLYRSFTMKKILIATLVAISSLISLPSLAGDLKMPPSSFSNVPPNNQKLVAVAEFGNLDVEHLGKNARMMTVEEMSSNRVTIASASNADEKKLCTVSSVSNPEFVSDHCVSALHGQATITIATFDYVTGAQQNERVVSRNEFYGTLVALNSVVKLDCHVANGKNTGTCIASNK